MSALERLLAALTGTVDLGQPLLALALVVLAALLVLGSLRAAPRAIPWPALAELEKAGGQRHARDRVVMGGLRFGALTCLALALAGPVLVSRGAPEAGEGLDLVLVVDASGSMRALDAELGGTWRTRLDLAREAVARFARTRAAEGDRVGVVVFGENAFTLCPLTSDGALLGAAVERIEAGIAGEATALGDALALALRRVETAASHSQSARQGPPSTPAAGRVVVLLTDGRSNTGVVPSDVAAGLARTLGVRVHAVGIGGEGAVAMAVAPGAAGAGLRFEEHDLDLETLGLIARSSGGRLFHARRARDLDAVYAEIDALERVPRRALPRLRRSARPEPALAAAGCLLALEILLGRVLWRRLP